MLKLKVLSKEEPDGLVSFPTLDGIRELNPCRLRCCILIIFLNDKSTIKCIEHNEHICVKQLRNIISPNCPWARMRTSNQLPGSHYGCTSKSHIPLGDKFLYRLLSLPVYCHFCQP